MLEILFIIFISRALVEKASAKGRSSAWGALGAGMWIAGEFTGACAGALMGMEMGVYLTALIGAAIGASAAWMIVESLPPAAGYDPFSDDAGGTPTCPECGSVQTERVGGLIQCYACDAVSDPSAPAKGDDPFEAPRNG